MHFLVLVKYRSQTFFTLLTAEVQLIPLCLFYLPPLKFNYFFTFGVIMKEYYVYIMASKRNGTLYTGVTSDLEKRVWQHKSKEIEGFTSKYNVNQLVYYEIHGDIMEAIKREKNIQAWKRNWKLQLIEKNNPNWNDLYNSIT